MGCKRDRSLTCPLLLSSGAEVLSVASALSPVLSYLLWSPCLLAWLQRSSFEGNLDKELILNQYVALP